MNSHSITVHTLPMNGLEKVQRLFLGIRLVLYLTGQTRVTQWAVTFLYQVSLRSHPRHRAAFSNFQGDLRNPGKKEQTPPMRLVKHLLKPSFFQSVGTGGNSFIWLFVGFLIYSRQTTLVFCIS